MNHVFNSNNSKTSPNKSLYHDRPLINFIWINSREAESDPQNPVCSIELANIKSAVDNANKYPEADFRIWVDKKLLDDYSLFCLESFIRDHAKGGNVALHDLQEIPDYAGDPYFVPLKPTDPGYVLYEFNRVQPRNVYSRADYARILVLDHCLQTCADRSRIIYSDIDCPDIRLPEALPRMEQYGVAIYDMKSRFSGNPSLSHGYIGLAADKPDVRKLFKFLKWETRDLAHQDYIGARAFEDFLFRMKLPFEKSHDKIGIPDLLPEMGTRPEPLFYTPPAKPLPLRLFKLCK